MRYIVHYAGTMYTGCFSLCAEGILFSGLREIGENILRSGSQTVRCEEGDSSSRDGKGAVGMLTSVEIRPVTGDDFLIPPERFLTRTRQAAVARIIAVHVNKAVAFAHLTG